MTDLKFVAEGGLGGDDQGDASIRFLPGDAVFRFQKGVGDERDPEALFQDDIARAEGLIGIARRHRGRQQDIAGGVLFVDQRRPRPQGFLHVKDGGQGGDLHGDPSQGLFQGLPVLGDDQRHGIAAVAHLVGANHGLVLVDDALTVGSGHVLPGQDRDNAGEAFGRAGIDAADQSMGDTGALGPGPEQVLAVMVRGIPLGAVRLGLGVRPRHTAPNFRNESFQGIHRLKIDTRFSDSLKPKIPSSYHPICRPKKPAGGGRSLPIRCHCRFRRCFSQFNLPDR